MSDRNEISSKFNKEGEREENKTEIQSKFLPKKDLEEAKEKSPEISSGMTSEELEVMIDERIQERKDRDQRDRERGDDERER